LSIKASAKISESRRRLDDYRFKDIINQHTFRAISKSVEFIKIDMIVAENIYKANITLKNVISVRGILGNFQNSKFQNFPNYYIIDSILFYIIFSFFYFILRIITSCHYAYI